VDISRIIRFDYGDPVYMKIAKDAYDLWSTSPIYKEAFFLSPLALVATQNAGCAYIASCLERLDAMSLPWQSLETAEETKRKFPTLTGTLAQPDFYGYCNVQAGWVDAKLAISGLRDRCIEAGVSFICGAHGSVVELQTDSPGSQVKAVKTKSGDIVHGDLFILATGAWTSRLVSMYNSILATGQVLGFLKLTEMEQARYKDLPIYINFDSGWFCFPPHENTGYLKLAVHGLGYTRSRKGMKSDSISDVSSPLITPRSRRTNFAPEDGIQRLRDGLKEVLPELAARDFDRTAVCWYTDTPTGDFVLDYHPDYKNVFLATGGSGQ
jgi:sarcosine oxidase/L-pipecolate oxidase